MLPVGGTVFVPVTSTHHPAAPWRRLALRRWVPYALLVLVCVLSVAASWYVSSTAEARVRAEFLTDAEETRQQIQVRLNTYFDVVRASSALLAASNEINGAEFRAFVAGLRLRERYPGMEGIGFSAHIRRQDLRSFLRAVDLDGVTPLRVWPPGQRTEYDPIMYLEPMDSQNRAAIGFDMSMNAILRAAMELARDTGQPTASSKLSHVPPFDQVRGGRFALLIPVYRFKAPLDTVEERRRALIGFVFSPFSSDDLLQQVVAAAVPSVTFEVYDGAVASPATLLNASVAVTSGGRYQSPQSVQVAGRDWLVVVRSGARVGMMAPAARGTLLGGLLLSLMLFQITRAQVRAWETAARHAAELRDSAQHDFLTELPNRALLSDHLKQAIALARRHGHHLAVLFMDLDRFKHINDSFGHAVGDQLLQSVAGRLLACVRRSDTVSRQGGDEFVVLLSEIEHAEDAAASAQKMINELTAPHDVAHQDIHITVSVGVSIYPDDGQDAASLISAADTAMYEAKEQGRNNYKFFKPAMNAQAVARQWIEAGLRRALVRKEFVLHYQPKMNLETGAITGAEALIRWVHPDRGLLGPMEFVPIAEDCRLIVPIGQWVLREACAQARAWLDAGVPMAMAVNISAIEFRDKNFFDNVCTILKESQLEPRYLEIELTESVLMQHTESMVSVLQALKDIGVKIAIDDFGTAYSSLSYLRQFPIDVVKVDQSFVHQITTDLDGTPIVSAMISMGRSLRYHVIAEGVETREQLTFLQAHRCGEGQGFYFSRPVVADQFAKLLETGMSDAVLH